MKDSTIQLYVDLEHSQRVSRSKNYQQSDGLMPMTMGWSKYRPHESRVIVRDEFGKEHWLTPIQHRVYTIVHSHEGETLTATIIANSLGVAVSTVTRALLMLAALRLIAYETIRGRNGGISILKRSWADLKARSKTAWTKIQMEREKVWDRYLRRLDRSHYWASGLNLATSTTQGRKIYGEA